jgi:hypothetical protein
MRTALRSRYSRAKQKRTPSLGMEGGSVGAQAISSPAYESCRTSGAIERAVAVNRRPILIPDV